MVFQMYVRNLVFATIPLSRFDKALPMSLLDVNLFNVVVGSKISKQYLQNVTSGSIRNK